MAKDTRKRFRFTVPEGDSVVMAWLAAQENVGMSLRQLIKFDCMEHITDVMCRPLPGMQSGYFMEREPVISVEPETRAGKGTGTPTVKPPQGVPQIIPEAPVIQQPQVSQAPAPMVPEPVKTAVGNDIVNQFF